MIAAVLIAMIIAIVMLFGMAKWTSILFSDIRNKLGNQVVFTNWKGRSVVRAYVKPSNPNTLKQQANRDVQRQAVSFYQTLVGSDVDRKAAWNENALPRLISGFNLFVKYARQIVLQANGDSPGAGDVTYIYTCPVDRSAMGLYRCDDDYANPVEVVGEGGLSPGVDAEHVENGVGAGSYLGFIGPANIFADLVGEDKRAAFCAHWKKNEAAGTATPTQFDIAA